MWPPSPGDPDGGELGSDSAPMSCPSATGDPGTIAEDVTIPNPPFRPRLPDLACFL